MKSPEDLLNDRLERPATESMSHGHHPSGLLWPPSERGRHPDIDDLVMLAHFLQQAPQIRVQPDFARHLERRMRRRHAELRFQRGHRQRSLWFLLRLRPALSIMVGICLLFCLVGTSVLALAAQVTDPTNPFYTITRWEQQVQTQLSGSPANQAALDLQFARDQLKTLSSLTGAAHEGAYQQALVNLDQQLDATASAIKSLPAGTAHDHLTSELASLKTETIQTLRGLLPRLTLAESLETTEELARLGDSVPLLTSAMLTLPAHLNGRATISLLGKQIEVGARLLVNGQVIAGNGTLHNGQITFVVDWHGNQSPQSLGILNPDGTAVQIMAITIKRITTNGNPGGNQNGNKPSVIPTPSGHKPSVTPTPNGHKPTETPTPHH
jgi:hypothetical protein